MSTSRPRILIVDDNRAIHDDFEKILSPTAGGSPLFDAERELFASSADAAPDGRPRDFRLTSALQGGEALELVHAALRTGDRFAVAFVDVRMPPGIDGIETARRIWAIDGDIEIVICTAYSDLSWDEMTKQLGAADRWVILKKPFDNVEVLQLAHALAEKWALRQQTKAQVAGLEETVATRTADLEAALRRVKNEVAQREQAQVERRLIERKMEEAQRLESLGVLAGGVAHDFNNLLTGILMSASLARIQALPASDLQKQLRNVEDNTRRAAGLCEQLLTYAGKSRLECRTLDLNQLVRDSIDLLRVSVPKDATFEVALAQTLPTVIGDAARLRQILVNVVLNAAEALAASPRRIRLTSGVVTLDGPTLERMAQPSDAIAGEFVYLEVADTGVGMAAATTRRIFEPFYTTKFTGRGLGLCAVLGIMRAHRGAIDVLSTLGQGTTVRIYLPLKSE